MPRPGCRVAALLVALVLSVLGLALTPGRAAAVCDCAGLSTVQALGAADAVFRGTVTDSRRVGRGEDARADVRFRVDAVYKGTAYADQVVATPPDADACGLEAAVGSTWVVFAVEGVEGSDDDAVLRLVTSRCSGSSATSTPPASSAALDHPPPAGRTGTRRRPTSTTP